MSLTEGEFSSVLREANITVFDNSVCENSYSILPQYEGQYPRGIIPEFLLCIGNTERSIDTCSVSRIFGFYFSSLKEKRKLIKFSEI